MLVLIVDCGSTKSPEIEKMVFKLGFKTQMVSLSNFTEHCLSNVCGLIISGAPILVTEIDVTPYLKKFNFLKTTKIPVLGICFGHQILGIVYGAIAIKCKEARTWQTIEIKNNTILFKNINASPNYIEDHCECISLPNNFKLLASSIISKNEAMQHVYKPLFGVQFHPEVSKSNGENLINNFLQLI